MKSSQNVENNEKSQISASSQGWITKKLVPKPDDTLKSTQNAANADELFSLSQVRAINEVFTSTDDVEKQANTEYVAATYDDASTVNRVNFASLLATEEADGDDMNDFLLPTQEDNKTESSIQVEEKSMSVFEAGKPQTPNPMEHDAQDFDNFEVSCLKLNPYTIIWLD